MNEPVPTSTTAHNFDSVETWVFDLDNTLYPHHVNLWHQVDERIRDYIARYLGLTGEEAFRLQKDYYQRYGTTMRGLMTEHAMAPDDFLDFVHQIDHSPLEPNPALGTALEKLPGRKLVLTNGTRKHADSVMRRLDGAGDPVRDERGIALVTVLMIMVVLSVLAVVLLILASCAASTSS